MPSANRLLESRFNLLLQNGNILSLEGPGPDPVYAVYPKTIFPWIDRTGITTADITGPLTTTGLEITSTAQSGTLVITADGTAMSGTIGIAIILWDERSNPISINSGMITLSGWCKNPDDNYITANSFGVSPGFLVVDVSLAYGYTILVQSIIPSGTVNLHWKLF